MIFLVITIVNLMVITKGSERASEVAARFSLDAMPGKQMAVDADMAAGLLDEHWRPRRPAGGSPRRATSTGRWTAR